MATSLSTTVCAAPPAGSELLKREAMAAVAPNGPVLGPPPPATVAGTSPAVISTESIQQVIQVNASPLPICTTSACSCFNLPISRHPTAYYACADSVPGGEPNAYYHHPRAPESGKAPGMRTVGSPTYFSSLFLCLLFYLYFHITTILAVCASSYFLMSLLSSFTTLSLLDLRLLQLLKPGLRIYISGCFLGTSSFLCADLPS